jgi:hypothetical protein
MVVNDLICDLSALVFYNFAYYKEGNTSKQGLISVFHEADFLSGNFAKL